VSETSKKTKVAILGGGLSPITAAYELTERPEDRGRYDITIYQMGWCIVRQLLAEEGVAFGFLTDEVGYLRGQMADPQTLAHQRQGVLHRQGFELQV